MLLLISRARRFCLSTFRRRWDCESRIAQPPDLKFSLTNEYVFLLSRAMGLAISGGGIGGLILAPVSQALMDQYDWRMAYRVGGAIAGVVGSCAGLLIKARMPPPKRAGGILAQFDFYRFKDFTFVRLYFSIMAASLSFFIPYAYIPGFAGTLGISPASASIIIGVMNACNACGRIVMGFVSDHFGAMNTWLLNIWLCCLSIFLIWWVFSEVLKQSRQFLCWSNFPSLRS